MTRVTSTQVVFDLEWRQRNGGEPAPELRSAVSRRVFAANEANLAPGIIALNNHGVVAVPTDTLYGMHLDPSVLQLLPLR